MIHIYKKITYKLNSSGADLEYIWGGEYHVRIIFYQLSKIDILKFTCVP
jgi:hypothetical protein